MLKTHIKQTHCNENSSPSLSNQEMNEVESLKAELRMLKNNFLKITYLKRRS